MLVAASFMFIQCTSDPIPGPAGANGADGVDGVDGVSTGPGTSTTELLAQKVFLGPQIDGVVDASWENVQQLTFTGTVPDPGNNEFQGYVGNSNDVLLRAQYDDEYIYFLAQWKDPVMDQSRDTWYFDPADMLWKQESNKPVFDGAGNITRDAFYEDKLAMQWDIDGTTTDWDTKTCYATCHAGTTETGGVAKHYTIAAGEHTDMWHWKSVRTQPVGMFDDKNVTDTPVTDARHGDAKVSGGYTNNKVTLTTTDTSVDVTVPKYYIPGKSDYYWILQSEIDNNTALEIVAVDSTGKLTDELGNVIDPIVDTDFQRPAGGGTHDPALKGMPSIFTSAFVGSSGDILSASTYTGNGWY